MVTIDTFRIAKIAEAFLPGRAAGWRGVAAMVSEGLATMAAKRRSRRALLALTDDQLKDIGLSRADAHREGLRPFWD
ncbi:DUF1127 domain-containing protein [Rhizobiales bacterium L72]|uniref:DUF1127 domain-containing protein n=1 Tax=Propylenella binzhouense TaxID=2555902 RepID=A0A964T610_9HYPH|nr:DUF1127 domain-containing protein [Propylenella binzhouense]